MQRRGQHGLHLIASLRTVFWGLHGFFHCKMHNSTPTSAGRGLAWPVCNFQAEGPAPFWDAERAVPTSLISSGMGTWQKRGGDTAEELESSVLPTIRSPRRTIRVIRHPPGVFALLPLLLLRKEQRAAEGQPAVLPRAAGGARRCGRWGSSGAWLVCASSPGHGDVLSVSQSPISHWRLLRL